MFTDFPKKEKKEADAMRKKILEILQRNIGLQTLWCSTHKIDMDQEILKQLHINRDVIRARINNLVSLMKMAVLRPNFLGTHLPLEVWHIIFSFFNTEELDINLSALFTHIVDQMNKN